MAQLMPLPLTVSYFSKIQIGFAFLVPAYLGSPGKRAVKRVRARARTRACVRVCVYVCVCYIIFMLPFDISFLQYHPEEWLGRASLK